MSVLYGVSQSKSLYTMGVKMIVVPSLSNSYHYFGLFQLRLFDLHCHTNCLGHEVSGANELCTQGSSNEVSLCFPFLPPSISPSKAILPFNTGKHSILCSNSGQLNINLHFPSFPVYEVSFFVLLLYNSLVHPQT